MHEANSRLELVMTVASKSIQAVFTGAGDYRHVPASVPSNLYTR